MMRLVTAFLSASLLTTGVGCAMLPSKSALTRSQPAPVSTGEASDSASAKLELPPAKSAQACLATAELMEKSGKLDEAISLYEKARHDDPNQKQVCRRLAVLHDTLGDFARADEEYKKALELYPKDADLLNDLGYSFYSRGEWATAENHLREVLKLKPDHGRAWVNLGLTYAQQERRDESLAAFEKAIPRDQALCNTAFVTAAHGKSAEALAMYQEALRVNPSNTHAQAATQKLQTK